MPPSGMVRVAGSKMTRGLEATLSWRPLKAKLSTKLLIPGRRGLLSTMSAGEAPDTVNTGLTRWPDGMVTVVGPEPGAVQSTAMSLGAPSRTYTWNRPLPSDRSSRYSVNRPPGCAGRLPARVSTCRGPTPSNSPSGKALSLLSRRSSSWNNLPSPSRRSAGRVSIWLFCKSRASNESPRKMSSGRVVNELNERSRTLTRPSPLKSPL